MALPRITVEQALYAAIVVVAFTIRFWDVGSRAMHGDEAVHAWLAWNLYNGTGYQYDPVYHGPLQFPVTALFYFLFGVSNTSGRLMAVLFGTALVGLPYFLRRELGRVPAILAAVFIAVSPAFVYDSRLERDDIFTSVFAMLLAIAIFGFWRTRRVGYIYLAAAAAALSFAAMENTYITYFVFGTFLIIALATEYAARRPIGEHIASFWARTGGKHNVKDIVLIGVLVVLVIAFLLSVFTGLYLPVPLVLALLLIALVHRQTFYAARTESGSSLGTSLRATGRQTWLGAFTIILAILFLLYSTFGTNLHGIWDASQPFFNTGGACPGNPFPLNPCRKDIIGGLFYWLSQHRVARGGQPWFYYPLLYSLYEQIAVVFGIAGIVWFMRRPTVFTSFLTYWAILMFGVYSWAGEKFPWLMIHPLLPFLLIGSMFVVDLVRQPDWRRWLVVGAAIVLGAIQLHNTFEVNFVNGATPVEMMVYVQSSPDTPVVAQKIEAVSNKVTNGNDLHVTIDSTDTWPFAWYLRDLHNAAYPQYPQLLQKPFSTNPVILVDDSHQAALLPQLRDYSGHHYILRWWFPEDYKLLTWSSFFRDLVDPGYWNVFARWQIQRRHFGPIQSIGFYYYVKHGLVSPY
ncbi:MAG: flippase activity-associated protein Agl23 [Chloroflexota bacterium]